MPAPEGLDPRTRWVPLYGRDLRSLTLDQYLDLTRRVLESPETDGDALRAQIRSWQFQLATNESVISPPLSETDPSLWKRERDAACNRWLNSRLPKPDIYVRDPVTGQPRLPTPQEEAELGLDPVVDEDEHEGED